MLLSLPCLQPFFLPAKSSVLYITSFISGCKPEKHHLRVHAAFP
ncbi:hypothetical protein BRYFOR_07027 [Marvinbryantia formatexigens DSM 14469]|uniref:Uncharacterized protein n=1 Tax=Marvinbryantia formatexigens DSM 14469 TaxID=478749 RepID=C6LEH8_9FIRM|nr:hypothetical protein BRYFOR_07027 [Marvinbryantia formatexigens DSM 14469]